MRAVIAVIDPIESPTNAGDICHTLREMRATLPILALQSCPQKLPITVLEALTREGVEYVLELTTPCKYLGALLQDYIQQRHSPYLNKLFSADLPPNPAFLRRLLRGTNPRILQLVAQGLSNDEISEQLALSPHTIKHYIDRLRAEIGARNRIALAAWVGRYAKYIEDQCCVKESLCQPQGCLKVPEKETKRPILDRMRKT